MQTQRTKRAERMAQAPTTRRDGGPDWAMILLGVCFFALYMWFAKQMESITFDTTFIATYCTFLSIFVVRCFMTAFSHRPH